MHIRYSILGIVALIIMGSAGCSSFESQENENAVSTRSLLAKAVISADNDYDRTMAIWEIFLKGTEIKRAPEGWYRITEGVGSTEDLMTLKGVRVSRYDPLTYVVYGYAHGDHTLTVVSALRDCKNELSYVKLVEQSIAEDVLHMVKFSAPSVWQESQPYPTRDINGDAPR